MMIVSQTRGNSVTPVAELTQLRLRASKIDEFLDRWNERRLGPSGGDMFNPKSTEQESALVSSQRILFRQVIGSFIGRFRPERREFHQRLEKYTDSALDHLTLSQTLEQMGIEALKRHLGVVLSAEDAVHAVKIYQLSFMPPSPPPPSSPK